MGSPTMEFQEIGFGSADYRKECELRNKVLRIPIGLSLFDENLGIEEQQMHFGLFDQDRNLIACVIAAACTPTEIKIRQMSVDSAHQGNGYGRSIINLVEDKLLQQGFTHFFLNSRMTAAGFYEKLGYTRVGQEFTEVGLPHIRMEKPVRRTGR